MNEWMNEWMNESQFVVRTEDPRKKKIHIIFTERVHDARKVEQVE